MMSSELCPQTTESVATSLPELPSSVDDSRILIVDDEDPVRRMFADYLNETYQCTTASTSEEALAYLAAESYALVISDMTMPGRNGIELLREIVARYPDTAVIMVSEVDRPQRVRDPSGVEFDRKRCKPSLKLNLRNYPTPIQLRLTNQHPISSFFRWVIRLDPPG
ncbi:MAG: response regulator [Pyrinomonadaceae bacterium]|nr:response regulator [Pyrinomonadaceae bacterium]